MATVDDFPVSFHFQVDFQKLGDHFQVSFTEGSGLDMRYETIPKPNDMGTRVQVLQGQRFGNITLKRPVSSNKVKDPFTTWVSKIFSPDTKKFVVTYDAIIKLLDAEGSPIAGWKCSCTYPVHWTFSELNAEKSGLVMETVVLACNRIERIT